MLTKPQIDLFELTTRPADGTALKLTVLGPSGPSVELDHVVAAGDKALHENLMNRGLHCAHIAA